MTKVGQPLKSLLQSLTRMAFAWLSLFSTQALELSYLILCKTKHISFFCLLSSTDCPFYRSPNWSPCLLLPSRPWQSLISLWNACYSIAILADSVLLGSLAGHYLMVSESASPVAHPNCHRLMFFRCGSGERI